MYCCGYKEEITTVNYIHWFLLNALINSTVLVIIKWKFSQVVSSKRWDMRIICCSNDAIFFLARLAISSQSLVVATESACLGAAYRS